MSELDLFWRRKGFEHEKSDEYIKYLLDTNLHLCRSLEMVIKTWIEGKGTDECRVKALRLARAAIAKAEGEGEKS